MQASGRNEEPLFFAGGARLPQRAECAATMFPSPDRSAHCGQVRHGHRSLGAALLAGRRSSRTPEEQSSRQRVIDERDAREHSISSARPVGQPHLGLVGIVVGRAVVEAAKPTVGAVDLEITMTVVEFRVPKVLLDVSRNIGQRP